MISRPILSGEAPAPFWPSPASWMRTWTEGQGKERAKGRHDQHRIDQLRSAESVSRSSSLDPETVSGCERRVCAITSERSDLDHIHRLDGARGDLTTQETQRGGEGGKRASTSAHVSTASAFLLLVVGERRHSRLSRVAALTMPERPPRTNGSTTAQVDFGLLAFTVDMAREGRGGGGG